MTASACHCPTLSSNSPVLLYVAAQTQINLDAWKDCGAQDSSLPFKKRKDTRGEHSSNKGGGGGEAGAERGAFDGLQQRAIPASGIRWEGTEDTVECACPAMMTRWLSHHCASGLPLPLLPSLPPWYSPPRTPVK